MDNCDELLLSFFVDYLCDFVYQCYAQAPGSFFEPHIETLVVTISLSKKFKLGVGCNNFRIFFWTASWVYHYNLLHHRYTFCFALVNDVPECVGFLMKQQICSHSKPRL